MRYEFVRAHQQEFPVRRLCQLLGISPSGYYAWQVRPESARVRANRKLLVEIRSVYARSRGTYGSPRVYADLRLCGFRVGRNRIARLLRLEKLFGSRRKKKFPRTTNSQHDYPVAPNRLNRDFQAARPNETWLADIPYIPTAEGGLYLAVGMDLFSRKIVGWSFADNLESRLVERAFQMAVQNAATLNGLLPHSDRGCQYAADAYQPLLVAQHVQVSMSRRGNCYDNAPMESFFGTLKSECVQPHNYPTRQEAITDIFSYIVGFYNRERLPSSLGYLSPDEFERRYYLSVP